MFRSGGGDDDGDANMDHHDDDDDGYDGRPDPAWTATTSPSLLHRAETAQRANAKEPSKRRYPSPPPGPYYDDGNAEESDPLNTRFAGGGAPGAGFLHPYHPQQQQQQPQQYDSYSHRSNNSNGSHCSNRREASFDSLASAGSSDRTNSSNGSGSPAAWWQQDFKRLRLTAPAADHYHTRRPDPPQRFPNGPLSIPTLSSPGGGGRRPLPPRQYAGQSSASAEWRNRPTTTPPAKPPAHGPPATEYKGVNRMLGELHRTRRLRRQHEEGYNHPHFAQYRNRDDDEALDSVPEGRAVQPPGSQLHRHVPRPMTPSKRVAEEQFVAVAVVQQQQPAPACANMDVETSQQQQSSPSFPSPLYKTPPPPARRRRIVHLHTDSKLG